MKTLIVILLTFFLITADFDKDFKQCSHLFAGKKYPQVPTNGAVHQLCKKQVIAILYNSDYKSPHWSAYHLKTELLKNATGERRGFILDDDLKAAKISQADPNSKAFNNEWHRGHLAPSNAFSYKTGKDSPHEQCYMMSNIALQAGLFNSGAWAKLERKIFDWVVSRNDLYSITGVIYKQPIPNRREDIAVPEMFYKLICDLKGKQSAAFMSKNTANAGNDCLTFHPVSYAEKFLNIKSNFPASCNINVVNPNHWWTY